MNRIVYSGMFMALFLGLLGSTAHTESSSHLNSVKTLVSIGQNDAALAILQNIPLDQLPEKDQGLALFSKGVLSYKAHRWDEARTALLEALGKKSQLGAYIHYFLGMTEKNLGNIKEAKVHFNKALKEKPAREFRYEIRYALGEIAVAQRHWKTAYKHFRYLQRRWKSSHKYPVILKRLVEVDLSRKKRWRACRWARNLYRNFPGSQAAREWTIDLQNVEVNGRKLGCLATFNDQKRRIRRFQWGGESQRAREEIEVLLKRSKYGAKYEVDILLANFFVNEGFVKEALAVLLPYYDKKKNDFQYLMLVGKASSRAGEFPTAVSAYYRAHLTKKRGSKGKNALFKAAFLSYQFQDYDGAFRKFARFNKLYPRSGLTRDARWHMAWLRYLKGDYDGAVTALTDVYKSAKRRRWRWKKYPLDKIRYWLAMSYYRGNDHSRARDIFESIVKEAPMGFYAQASRSRLEKLPEPPPAAIRGLASADLDNTAELSATGETIQLEDQAITGNDDSETEDVVMAEEQTKDDLTANEVPVTDEAGEVVSDDEEVHIFRSVRFADRLERAMQLIQVGEFMWAKNELYEIEKRTRKREHREKLIQAYETILSYNRSSYIAQIHFSKDRHRKGGLKDAEGLWKSAYPRAFEQEVNHFSRQFGIEKEFIWGLMRAESRYKQDISSPVGARGLMQLMPHTATQVSRLLGDESFDPSLLVLPEVNIRLGTRYLQRLSKKFKGQLPLMAAGYNAGPHRVESWLSTFGHLEMDEFIEHIPFVETRKYVKKVTRNYGVYRALYNGNVAPLAWLPESITIPPGTRPVSRETWEKL